MVWVLEKKIFDHILDMGFERVVIPVRAKFEFDVKKGTYVPDSLSVDSIYNPQASAKRYSGVNMVSLDGEIQKTIQREIRNDLQRCGYIFENINKYD